jgi:protein SCO1/2
MQTPTSHTKIIALLVFICAAMLASVFVYHMGHKPATQEIATNEGIIFPQPREIKSFHLLTTDKQIFTERNLSQHWTLLFFGFTHCTSICPATLERLKHVYAKLHATYPTLQIVFVSLDPERDDMATLGKYVHSFNPQFIGASGNIGEVRKLQSQLGIFSEAVNTNSHNYQIQHSASIIFINPNGQWAGTLNVETSPTELSELVNRVIKDSSVATHA